MSDGPDAPQLIDVRLVRTPDGTWGIAVEGHRLERVGGMCPAAALHALSDIVHTISEGENRSETSVLLEVTRDTELVRRFRQAQAKIAADAEVKFRQLIDLQLRGAPMPPRDAVDAALDACPNERKA